MKLSEYRNSSSWQGAIELGPKLMNLAEELPASEEMGLSLQLRTLMVELPATIAADFLRAADSDVRLLPVLKLVATLELIDLVYPALDTAALRNEADTLAERLMSPDTLAAAPAPAAAPTPEVHVEPAETPVLAAEVAATPPEPAATESEPEPREAAPDAAETELEPAPEALPAAAEPAAPVTVVPVAATPAPEDTNVQPDSVQ